MDQSEMAKQISDFRMSNSKSVLNLSGALCTSATEKAKSLYEKGTAVSLSSDFFNSNEKMIYMQVRGIDANSQNTVSTFTMLHPALDSWKVILEEETFSGKNWQSIGTGFYKNYAVLWFSDKVLNDKPTICNDSKLNNQTAIIIKHKKEVPVIRNGRWLVEPTYYKMGYEKSENNLYPVANDSEKWGFINLSGEVVIPFQFERAYSFTEGLAPVFQNGKAGYINSAGEIEIPLIYSSAGYFYKGTALVAKDGKNFMINQKGEQMSDESVDMDMLNDNYIAYKSGGLYGIKDLSGNVLKKPFMTDFFGYREGLAAVKVGGKWGFMDENFNMVIPPAYTEKLVYAFHNGIARFKKNGKVGAINKTGSVVIDAKYDDLYEYENGLLPFMQNGKWGYMKLNEEAVITPQYLSAIPFEFGVAIVKDTNLKSHLINSNNEQLLSDMDEIIIFSEKLFGVDTKGGWGLVELNR
ncbi:MAG: WG repeat-containing protein [Chloroflexia bacterium]|nr:WG repeat-containing protein [Chloroflexia bacterium]